MTTIAQGDPVKDRMWHELIQRQPCPLYPLCELQGEGCTGKATDMHEIINRAHISKDFQYLIPVEFRSALCRNCNIRHADGRAAKVKLLTKNLMYYGYNHMLAAYFKFIAAMDVAARKDCRQRDVEKWLKEAKDNL